MEGNNVVRLRPLREVSRQKGCFGIPPKVYHFPLIHREIANGMFVSSLAEAYAAVSAIGLPLSIRAIYDSKSFRNTYAPTIVRDPQMVHGVLHQAFADGKHYYERSRIGVTFKIRALEIHTPRTVAPRLYTQIRASGREYMLPVPRLRHRFEDAYDGWRHRHYDIFLCPHGREDLKAEISSLYEVRYLYSLSPLP